MNMNKTNHTERKTSMTRYKDLPLYISIFSALVSVITFILLLLKL